ncbi:hypothetical protein GF312_22650 [Candidatus Poribacteria bacterium]|nr:hypothetical protein [Candidatus Poribacteria bacterium]
MANMEAIKEAFEKGFTLAVADQILIKPEPGTLVARVKDMFPAIRIQAKSTEQVCETLIRMGMNLVGRDAEIVGYNSDEIDAALEQVLMEIDGIGDKEAMAKVVENFLKDMKSVNMADSLTALLAERIEPDLYTDNAGRSFLMLLKKNMRSGVYWEMIGDGYCKFGNDFARGLEYLRHYGFCQVSTNPVLAAKAFDEDVSLIDELKEEIDKHDDWKQNPEDHANEITMAGTLIALWPNLSIFRPLALYTGLKDYMVSFQLNPNIADQAEASIEDARNAHSLAADFLKDYDRMLGLDDNAGKTGPCIVFKVSGGDKAARKITTVLNSEGIGTNNTVVYTVAQEVQLVLDAFEGKAKAAKAGNDVVRTYETNMGGRFVSHLREVEAEKIFVAAAEKDRDKAAELLDKLAKEVSADEELLSEASTIAKKARVVCAYKNMKSLDQPTFIEAAKLAGMSEDETKLLEADLKKGGTLVARGVYWIYYSPENRPKWISYLSKTYDLDEEQAKWILESMDVLPASKRVPADTLDALGKTNMCHTEFPNHARAVQLASEEAGFNLEDYRESVLDRFDPDVEKRLTKLDDFVRGYNLTPALKELLLEVGIDVEKWYTEGLKPEEWPNFGSVQKTSTEFKKAYDTFAAKCVDLAKEVAGK